jgi:hypothetical protein
LTEETASQEASTPAAAPSAPAESAPALNDAVEKLTSQLAKKEDIGDYIAETKDFQAFKDGDQSVNDPARVEARLERWKVAMAEAQKEADAAAGPTDTKPDPQAADAALESRLKAERVGGKLEARIQNYEEANPGFFETVRTTFNDWGMPASHVDEIISESAFAPQILHALTQYPEQIEALNNLSPRDVDRFIGIMEGGLMAQRHEAANPKPQPLQPRRETNAPPPMKQVSGGASVPPDIATLAKKEDASDVIRAWKARDKARARA